MIKSLPYHCVVNVLVNSTKVCRISKYEIEFAQPHLAHILDGRSESFMHGLLSQKLEKVRPLALQNLLVEAYNASMCVHVC